MESGGSNGYGNAGCEEGCVVRHLVWEGSEEGGAGGEGGLATLEVDPFIRLCRATIVLG